MKKLAFTLIELLVVIAIIGILSGLIVVAMGGITNGANIAKAQIFSNSLRNSLMMNLISEWKLDGSGVADGGAATTSYTQDTWSGGNNGTLSATPPTVRTGTNCVSGSCLQFDGSSNYVDFGNKSVFNIANALTVSVWVKPVLAKSNAYIFAKGWQDQYDLYLNSTNNVVFTLVNSTSPDIHLSLVSLSRLSLNVWYNIACTFDGSVAKIYLNGVLSNNQNWNYAITTSVQTLKIGVTNTGYDTWFNGLIDEVRMYNAAMPTSQIKEQYYAGLGSLLASGQIGPQEYAGRIDSLAKF